MAPYIYEKRNLIHIIDIRETIKGLIRTYRFLERLAAEGGQVIFVGTKRQARISIREFAESANMPYVNERWLGGTLTNFSTIQSRVKSLIEMEELVASDIFQSYSKKLVSSIRRKLRKMHKNLNGIRNLTRLPDALVVIDPRREANAVREAKRVKIPVIALIDTDSDPDPVDILISGNDDSVRTIKLIIQKCAEALINGQKQMILNQTKDKPDVSEEIVKTEQSATKEKVPTVEADQIKQTPQAETVTKAAQATGN